MCENMHGMSAAEASRGVLQAPLEAKTGIARRVGCARKKQNDRWNRKNRRRRQTSERDYYRRNKPAVMARARRNKLRVQYGLTVEGFHKLLCVQSGRCAICVRLFGITRGDAPHIDHDHATGKVRELLCPSCNHGIGEFVDSVDLLAAAIKYLGRTPAL